MLNEMLIGRLMCPVCERIIYGPLKGWWCPYCGHNMSNADLDTTPKNTIERITARDEVGRPYYIGKFTMRERAFEQDLGLSAIAEILEKLCQYEEEEENSTALE